MARIEYPTYYQELLNQAYPFDPSATRSNGQVSISNEIFLDGRIYLPKTPEFVYINEIKIDKEIEISLADESSIFAVARSLKTSDTTELHFYDKNNIYYGLLQLSKVGIKILSDWPEGNYQFNINQTKLTHSVVIPQPQVVVRAIKLESGDLFFGDVYLVGEKGVQLTVSDPSQQLSSSSSTKKESNFIRVDIVGDPLFIRKQCLEEGSDGPDTKFIKLIDFRGQKITPDEFGGMLFLLKAQVNFSPTPALRIIPRDSGLKISFVKNG